MRAGWRGRERACGNTGAGRGGANLVRHDIDTVLPGHLHEVPPLLAAEVVARRVTGAGGVMASHEVVELGVMASHEVISLES